MTGRLEEVLSTTTAVSPTDIGALEHQMREKMRAGRERTTSACSSSGPELGTSPTDPGGTPTRRNKRKMTAPKRRSDFSIKRFCPELMSGDEHRDEHGDDLEDYDDLGRERVPDRPAASTGSSPDSRRDSRPSSTATSPGDADLRPPSSPASTPDLHHRRRASSRLSSHDEELIPSPVSPHPSRGELGRHRHGDDPQLVHPMGLHHPAFGLSRHLALGHTLPVHLTSVPMATPAGLLPGHPHLQGVPGAPQGLLPLPHLQVAYPGVGGPSSPVEFHTPGPPSPTDSTSSMADGSSCSGGKKARKNYKNMTRERRVEANARERSRVHTISAAFDSLRRAVPSYSYNQKLSKLAILRIACSYILSLAKLADLDLSTEHSDYTFADCVDMCTSVIQTEGRARRRH